MDAQIYIGGRLYHGTFVTRKSVLVVGDTLYVLANFRPHPSTPLHPTLRPVHLLRIRLNGAEGGRRIKPLSQPRSPSDPCPDRIRIGLFSGSASPSAWVDPAGQVQIFAQAHALIAGDLHATITAVRDDGSQLKRSWWCAFGAVPDDGIYSAPAFHAPTRTLIVCTMGRIYVLSRVGERVGLVPRPVPLRPEQLLSPSAVNRMARVRVGSPLAVTYDHDRDEIVVYTNFRVLSALTTESFGLMGGFALKSRGGPPAPLWHHPLAISRDGKIEPGPGTLGQPALFQYPGPTGPSQGLLVNTVRTGTYVFR
jgi:hypothetical protein